MIALTDVPCRNCGMLLESNDKEVCKLCVRETRGLRNQTFRFYGIVKAAVIGRVPRLEKHDSRIGDSHARPPLRKGQLGQQMLEAFTKNKKGNY